MRAPCFDVRRLNALALDEERGGRFRIRPTGAHTSQQRYFPFTNILVTSFHLHDGSGVIEVLELQREGRARMDAAAEPRAVKATASVGSSFTASVKVCNQGTTPTSNSSGTRLELYLSADTELNELGAVLEGQAAGRINNEEITIFKSLGLAFEDVLTAAALLSRHAAQGNGRVVEL